MRLTQGVMENRFVRTELQIYIKKLDKPHFKAPNKGFGANVRGIDLTVMIIKLIEFRLDGGYPPPVKHD